MRICASYVNLCYLVEWCFQVCLEGSCLPDTLTVCVWTTFILSAGLLLVTWRVYCLLDEQFGSQVTCLSSESLGAGYVVEIYDELVVSHFLIWPFAQGTELEEFSLTGWMGTFFCLFVLVVSWEWGRPPQADNLKILHYILLFLFGFYIGSNRPITGVSVLHDIVEELQMIYSCYRQYSWTV